MADRVSTQVTADLEFARDLARRTGELLVDLRAEIGFVDRRALMNAGDGAAQKLIAERLNEYRPNDAVLSEEAPDSRARLSADRVWIIDPVDGTSAYAKEGSTEWAVHIALWERGQLTVGVVGRPATGEIFDSGSVTLGPLKHDNLRIVGSRSRATKLFRDVCDDLDAEIVSMSSAGIKVLAVVTGEADAYLHSGGQYQWDNAAPVAVAKAAGLHATRIDGSEIVYNEESTSIEDLVICRPEHVEDIQAAIRRHV